MTPLPSPDAVLDLIRSRRTVTLFRPDPVPADVLHRAFDAARWAPNHRLTEPWRFYLIGPETAAEMVALNTRLVAEDRGERAAENKHRQWSAVPGWLAVTTRIGTDPLREREDYAACCAAIQNLMLYLWSEGVATKWSTGPVTRSPEFYRLAGIDPEREMLVGLVCYGYPMQQPAGIRRPIEEFVVVRP
ncbi:MAG TPA: nitroreductase [Rhodothermales bacterium]